jgi:hypothetical protein
MITKLSQLEQDQMYLLCIHIENVLVHDSIRWDLMWPQSISLTNQCCATCKGASSCTGAARAALAAPHTWGARPCRALGKNRPGRPRLGRAGPNRVTPRPGRTRRAPWTKALCAPRRGRREMATPRRRGWPHRRARPPKLAGEALRGEPPRRCRAGQAAAPGRHTGAALGRRAGAPWPNQGVRGGGGAPRRASSERTRAHAGKSNPPTLGAEGHRAARGYAVCRGAAPTHRGAPARRRAEATAARRRGGPRARTVCRGTAPVPGRVAGPRAQRGKKARWRRREWDKGRGWAGAVGEDEQGRGGLVGGTHPQAAAALPSAR